MKPATYARVALTIPLFVVALLMAPILASALQAGARPIEWDEVLPLLELLASFGLPQYIVLAVLLLVLMHGRTDSQIKRLALWAPVIYVPILLAPFLTHARSVSDVLSYLAMPGLLGLGVGYICVALAFAMWPQEAAHVDDVRGGAGPGVDPDEAS